MEENKKPIRIGKVTFGIILILVGIVIFIQTLTNLDILRYVLMLWPLVLISFGIEILIYRNKENIKYDVWGGIFTLIIVGIVSLFSIANYGINKLLYDENIQEALVEHTSNAKIETEFKDVVTLTNIKDNNKVSVKINEIDSATNTEVRIKVSTNNEKFKNKFRMFDIDAYNYFFIDSNSNTITLLDNFEEYDNIEITIITQNKENITIK